MFTPRTALDAAAALRRTFTDLEYRTEDCTVLIRNRGVNERVAWQRAGDLLRAYSVSRQFTALPAAARVTCYELVHSAGMNFWRYDVLANGAGLVVVSDWYGYDIRYETVMTAEEARRHYAARVTLDGYGPSDASAEVGQ